VLALAAVAAAATSCGRDRSAGYVGTASNAALYVTWTRAGDELSGQLTQALSDATTGTVDSERTSFTGTVRGDAVSLCSSVRVRVYARAPMDGSSWVYVGRSDPCRGTGGRFGCPGERAGADRHHQSAAALASSITPG
jgi:hypothetical protein